MVSGGGGYQSMEVLEKIHRHSKGPKAYSIFKRGRKAGVHFMGLE